MPTTMPASVASLEEVEMVGSETDGAEMALGGAAADLVGGTIFF